MLQVTNLTCLQDQRVLFDPLNFMVQAGDIVQVAGQNGAGKTSLLRILTGLSRPDEGQLYWQQIPLQQQRVLWHQAMLYIGHQPGIKSALTASENLRFYHPRQSQVAIDLALDELALRGFEDIPVAQLSAGQQRRVALARLWLTEAVCWILDEPLTAIDTAGVGTLMDKFASHVEQGGMLILTAHQELTLSTNNVRKISLCPPELL